MANLYELVVAEDLPCYCLAAVVLWGSAGMFSLGLLLFAALYTLLSKTAQGESTGGKCFVAMVLLGTVTLWMLSGVPRPEP